MRRILLACALCLPLPALAQTAEEERDRGFLAGLIEDNLSTVSRQVVIDGFRGALSSRATVDRLTIADEEGVWLTATDLVLDWNRYALLNGRLAINTLGAGEIVLLRPPEAEPAPPSPEASPFALPELPVSIEIGTLNAERIVLGEAVIGQPVAVTLDGAVSLAGGEGTADIVAERLDGAGRFVIAGSYSNATRILGLDVALTEGPGGLVATLIGLPGGPAVAMTLAGTGPIDDYAAELSLATDGVDRVTGEFGLLTVPDPAGGPPGQQVRVDIAGDVAALLPADYAAFFGDESRVRARGARDGDGTIRLPELTVETRSLSLRGAAEVGVDGWPTLLSLTGALRSEDGTPVLLPRGGPRTFVQEARLGLVFDARTGDRWDLTFDAAGVSRPDLTIDALRLAGGGVIRQGDGLAPGLVTGDLDYAATGLQPVDAGLATALGEAAEGRIRFEREATGPLRIRQLSLEGPGVALDAEATVGAPGDGFPTRVSALLEAADLARFGPLLGLPLTGSARLDLELDLRPFDGAFVILAAGETADLGLGIAELDPLLAGAGTLRLRAARDTEGTRIEDLEIATPALTVTGTADITSAGSTADFDLRIADVAATLPGARGPATAVGTARIDAAGQTLVSAEIVLPNGTAQLDATRAPRAEGGTISGMLEARLTDLAPFSTFAGRPLGGAAGIDLAGVLAADASTLDVTAAAVLDNLRLGEAGIDPLLVGRTEASARVIRLGPQTWRIEEIAAASPLLTAAGTVTLDGAEVATDGLRLAVPDLSPLSTLADRPLAGGIEAEAAGRLRTDLSLFDLDLSLATRDLSLEMPDIDPLLAGALTLAGRVERSAEQAYAVEGLRLTGPLITAEGDVRMQAGEIATEGLSVAVADLAPFSGLAGRPLGGAVAADASGRLASDLSLFDLEVSARTTDLRTGLAQIDPLLAGAGRLNAGVARTGPQDLSVRTLVLSTPVLALTAAGDLAGGAGEGRLDLSLSDTALIGPGLSGGARVTGTMGTDETGRITANLDARGPGGLTARIEAAARQAADRAGVWEIDTTTRASLDSLAPYSALAGRPLGGGVDLTVSGTARSDLGRFDLTVEGRTRNPDIGIPTVATLLRGEGTLGARLRRTDGNSLIVEALRLTFPNLTATGSIDGANGAGQAQFDARLADIGLFTTELSGPVTAAGTAALLPSGLWRVETDVTGPGGIGAAISGTAAPSGRLDLRVIGAAPLGLANAYIEPRRIEGVGRIDLAINGPPALSSVSGTVTLADARLSAPTLGQALTDIAGTIRLTGRAADLDLSARAQAGGSLTLSGPVELSGPFAANLALNLRGIVLRDPTLYQTTADGAITVTGPLTGGARIAGLISLGRTEIQVPSSGIGALGEMPEVLHRNAPGEVRLTLDRAGLTINGAPVGGTGGGGAAAYPLDLTVRAPARVFIRGRGLDAELGGELRVGGTTALVVPSGEFSLVRGRLDILQQRFMLTEGSVTLEGDFVPRLRLIADTETRDGTTVRIAVEGPATEPEVTFSATPDLPQDEVLARLLFGRDLSSISPLQAVQLAAAVGTLAGRGGAGIIGNLRQSIGLDDLDLTTDDEGNAALRVGKYLSDNVYTDVTVGSDRTEINLNLDLTDSLTARGTVSSDGETSIGIFFERDY